MTTTTKPDGTLEEQPVGAKAQFDWLKEAGSDQMTFSMKRPPTAAKMFSAKAMRELLDAITLFVGARISDHWEKGPKGPDVAGPSEINVAVSVTIDGQSFVVPLDKVPFFEIDGSLRH